MEQHFSPLALIISDCNTFSKALVFAFLEVNCGVVIVGSDTENWQKELQGKSGVVVIDFANKDFERYVINANYLSIFPETKLLDTSKIDKLLTTTQVKTLVLDREENGSDLQNFLSVRNNVAAISLYESAKGESHAKTCQDIIHLLFSFGFPPRNVTKLTVRPYKLYEEKKQISQPGPPELPKKKEEQEVSQNRVKSNVLLPPPEVVSEKRVIEIPQLKNISLIQTEINQPLKVNPRKRGSNAWKVAVVAVFVFLSPLLVALFGIGSLVLSKNYLQKGNIVISRKLVQVADGAFGVSQAVVVAASKTPVVGSVLVSPSRYLALFIQTTKVAQSGFSLFDKAVELNQGVMGNDTYDATSVANSLEIGLSNLYSDLGFLQTQKAQLPENSFFSSILSDELIAETRKKVLAFEGVARELPDVLGATGKKSYLVLLQNNMELRPTGGFIGSFALVSFDQGRLVETVVYDVYAADGQLKGHVDPPAPIKDYLGEANWFLRDANWDIDFATSAQKVEWFLDKELSKKVDGVMAIDLEFVKKVLAATGPVYLADFDTTIDADNLYTKTQFEVEANFFPGSQKKANFLTALTRNILVDLTEVQSDQFLAIANAFVDSFDEKHVQAYLHNSQVQNNLAVLGWSSVGVSEGCGANCLADTVGVVEANVGVNKANYFIQRSNSLLVKVDTEKIEKTLSVQLRNTASIDLGDKGKYKVYVRAFDGPDSDFSQVKIVSGEESTVADPEITTFSDRKEAGVLADVLPGQTKTLVFKWSRPNSLNMADKGVYELNIRKQAGTNADPWVIQTYFPNKLNLSADPAFSLTGLGYYGYNTALSRDFNSRISF